MPARIVQFMTTINFSHTETKMPQPKDTVQFLN